MPGITRSHQEMQARTVSYDPTSIVPTIGKSTTAVPFAMRPDEYNGQRWDAIRNTVIILCLSKCREKRIQLLGERQQLLEYDMLQVAYNEYLLAEPALRVLGMTDMLEEIISFLGPSIPYTELVICEPSTTVAGATREETDAYYETYLYNRERSMHAAGRPDNHRSPHFNEGACVVFSTVCKSTYNALFPVAEESKLRFDFDILQDARDYMLK